MSDAILVHRQDAIVHITFNRPEKKNAFTQAMYQRFNQALRDADADSEVAAVFLHGSGDSFSAGNDLHDFLQLGEVNLDSPAFQLLQTLTEISVPLVAGVNGLAIGIGTTLLLHCDLVYASDKALFCLPFVHLGLVPEAGSSQLLPQLCGRQRAAELLLLGDTFSADKAASIGLVNDVVGAEQLADKLNEVAEQLSQRPRQALRQSKQLLQMPAEPVADRIRREGQIFVKALNSDAAKAAIAAKLKKK